MSRTMLRWSENGAAVAAPPPPAFTVTGTLRNVAGVAEGKAIDEAFLRALMPPAASLCDDMLNDMEFVASSAKSSATLTASHTEDIPSCYLLSEGSSAHSSSTYMRSA